MQYWQSPLNLRQPTVYYDSSNYAKLLAHLHKVATAEVDLVAWVFQYAQLPHLDRPSTLWQMAPEEVWKNQGLSNLLVDSS